MAQKDLFFIMKLHDKNSIFNAEITPKTIMVDCEGGDVYVDIDDKTRIKTTKIVVVDAKPTDVSSGVEGQLYYSIEDDEIYKFTAATNYYSLEHSWPAVLEVVSPYTVLIPGIFKRHGTSYAPKTLAEVTYLSNGETVEERLKSMFQLGSTTITLNVETDGQYVFDITCEPNEDGSDPYAFLDYPGTYIEVRVGSTYIAPDRYYLEGRRLTFLEQNQYYLLAGRKISLLCLYNATLVPGETIRTTMDGSYIAPHTINSAKLSKISDRVDLPDPTSVASSKAVSSLNDIINNSRPNSYSRVTPDTTSTGTSVSITIPGFTLTHGDSFAIHLKTGLVANAVISFNGTSYGICHEDGSAVKANEYPNDSIIKVSYDAVNGKFVIFDTAQYKIVNYHNVYECENGEYAFEITDPTDYSDKTDSIMVYCNGLALSPGLNYELKGNMVELSYNVRGGTVVDIVISRIVPLI